MNYPTPTPAELADLRRFAEDARHGNGPGKRNDDFAARNAEVVLTLLDTYEHPRPLVYAGGTALADISAEATAAILKFPPMNSAHEGYAVLLEEVDELWDIVKVKQGDRDLAKMRKEAVQVAAMALRFIVDVCDGGRGQK